MRHLITGLVAAVAVMATAPAMACGYTSCAPQVYVAPVVSCDPCNSGWGFGHSGGWVHERLADPVQQYYHVNQGPTYGGPGNYAPAPVYQEGSVGYGYGGYSRHYGYRGYAARHYGGAGYGYGYRANRYGYGHGYGVRRGIGYGYGARYGYNAGRYGARYGGYHGGARMGGAAMMGRRY